MSTLSTIRLRDSGARKAFEIICFTLSCLTCEESQPPWIKQLSRVTAGEWRARLVLSWQPRHHHPEGWGCLQAPGGISSSWSSSRARKAVAESLPDLSKLLPAGQLHQAWGPMPATPLSMRQWPHDQPKAATTTRWAQVWCDQFSCKLGMCQVMLSGTDWGKGHAWKRVLALPWEAGTLHLMPVCSHVLRASPLGSAACVDCPSIKIQNVLAYLQLIRSLPHGISLCFPPRPPDHNDSCKDLYVVLVR